MSQHSDLSPYAASKVIEHVLAKHEISEKQTPQWLYGYAKRGVIAATCDQGSSDHRAHAKCTHVMFDGDAFAAWLQRYVAGRVSGSSVRGKTDFAALAAEYDEQPVAAE
jgi:hypothetical protein